MNLYKRRAQLYRRCPAAWSRPLTQQAAATPARAGRRAADRLAAASTNSASSGLDGSSVRRAPAGHARGAVPIHRRPDRARRRAAQGAPRMRAGVQLGSIAHWEHRRRRDWCRSTDESGDQIWPEVSVATGSCLCGAVRYEVTGPLQQVLICHCEECRRWHGHVSATAASERGDLQLLEQRGLRWIKSPRSDAGAR